MAERIGVFTGFVVGIAVNIGGVIAYRYAKNEGYPKFLYIPVATNIISGAYEIGRKMYNNARERVMKKHRYNLEVMASKCQ